MLSDTEKIRLIKKVLRDDLSHMSKVADIQEIVFDGVPVDTTVEYVIALVPDPREHVRTDLYASVDHATVRPADRDITGPRTKIYTLCDKGGYIAHGAVNPLARLKPFNPDAAHVCKKCARKVKKALAEK